MDKKNGDPYKTWKAPEHRKAYRYEAAKWSGSDIERHKTFVYIKNGTGSCAVKRIKVRGRSDDQTCDFEYMPFIFRTMEEAEQEARRLNKWRETPLTKTERLEHYHRKLRHTT